VQWILHEDGSRSQPNKNAISECSNFPNTFFENLCPLLVLVSISHMHQLLMEPINNTVYSTNYQLHPKMSEITVAGMHVIIFCTCFFTDFVWRLHKMNL
jgi:hypothetical protein